MTSPSHAFSVLVGAASALAISATAAAQDRPVTGVVRVDGRPQKEVVLWLSGVDAPGRTPATVVLDQRNLTFTPRILVVQTGTRVDMPNSDRVFHNVFSYSRAKRFDLGRYPRGESKTVTFDIPEGTRPGEFEVFVGFDQGAQGAG